MQGFQSGALNRVVHQLVSLIVYDLMRSDVRRVAASLTILMRNRPPLPGGARILLVLERPVEARGDGRHVERAYRRPGNSVAKNIHVSTLATLSRSFSPSSLLERGERNSEEVKKRKENKGWQETKDTMVRISSLYNNPKNFFLKVASFDVSFLVTNSI